MAIQYPGQQKIGYGKAQVYDTSNLPKKIDAYAEKLAMRKQAKKKAKNDYLKSLKDVDVSNMRNIDVPEVHKKVNAISEHFYKNAASIQDPSLDGGKARMESDKLRNAALMYAQQSNSQQKIDNQKHDLIKSDKEHYGTTANWRAMYKIQNTCIGCEVWDDVEIQEESYLQDISMSEEQKEEFYAGSKDEQETMIVDNSITNYEGLSKMEKQTMLVALGYDLGTSGTKGDGADGDWGDKSKKAEELFYEDINNKDSELYKKQMESMQDKTSGGESKEEITQEMMNDGYTGKGTYDFGNGNKYEGEWKNGKKDGQGIITFPDGATHEGEFKDGLHHGQGTATTADGTVYNGIWENGEFVEGSEIEEEALGDNKEVENMTEVTIDMITGEKKYTGRGTYTSDSGNKKNSYTYVGEFKNGKEHGEGKLTYADGSIYAGEWKGGEYHGKGTLTFADGTVRNGLWQLGKFMEGSEMEGGETTNAPTGFRTNKDIDSKRVDKFSVQGSAGENKANVLKDGKPIEVKVMGGIATVTGVRAEGNNLIVDVKAPFGGGAKDMGKFVESGDGYEFEPNQDIYGQLKGEDKKDFDAFIKSVESDPEFAKQLLASVAGTEDFNPSEYGYEETTTGGKPRENYKIEQRYEEHQAKKREPFVMDEGIITEETVTKRKIISAYEPTEYKLYVEDGGVLSEEQFKEIHAEQSEYETAHMESQGTTEKVITQEGGIQQGAGSMLLTPNTDLGAKIQEWAGNIEPDQITSFQDGDTTKFRAGDGNVTLYTSQKEASRGRIINAMTMSIDGNRFKEEMWGELESELKERNKGVEGEMVMTMDDLLIEKASPFVKSEDKSQFIRDVLRSKTSVRVGGDKKHHKGVSLKKGTSFNYSNVINGVASDPDQKYTTKKDGVAVAITESTTGGKPFFMANPSSSGGYRILNSAVNVVPGYFKGGKAIQFQPAKIEYYNTATDNISWGGYDIKKGDIVPDNVAAANPGKVGSRAWLLGTNPKKKDAPFAIRFDNNMQGQFKQWVDTRTTDDGESYTEIMRKAGIPQSRAQQN